MIPALLRLLSTLQGSAMAQPQQDQTVELDFSQPQQTADLQTLLQTAKIPEFKQGAVWGTQTNYPQTVVQSAQELSPLLSQLNDQQKQMANFISSEAQKRGIDPGFAVAQAIHETYRNKDLSTIFSNPGGNLTGVKATKADTSYSFPRTFEKLSTDSWISELQKRPWIIFEPGTTKQDKKIINTSSETTKELNRLLQQARETKDWTKLQTELSKFKSDDNGNLAISIRDRFKKFNTPQEGAVYSLDMLRRKLKQ
ncbi:hypothetical protein EBZ38_03305 [bacterium]|nr:hypothetical protein [bacterium]NDC93989.1 hypothetical protein [bacterium]NDD83294.1 hypothetical protein [bacterium]